MLSFLESAPIHLAVSNLWKAYYDFSQETGREIVWYTESIKKKLNEFRRSAGSFKQMGCSK